MGVSERALGKALGARQKDVTVVTKGGVGYPDAPNRRDSTRRRLAAALDNSLRNLGTDHVDVYLVHWPDINTPFEETMGTLDDVVRQGKARYIGVSNFRLSQLETCMKLRRIDVVQYGWNMFDRRMRAEIFPWCQTNNTGVMAYGSLAYGLLSGTFHASMNFDENDRRANRGTLGSLNLFRTMFGPDHFPHIGALLDHVQPRDRHRARRLPPPGRSRGKSRSAGLATIASRDGRDRRRLARHNAVSVPDGWLEDDQPAARA